MRWEWGVVRRLDDTKPREQEHQPLLAGKEKDDFITLSCCCFSSNNQKKSVKSQENLYVPPLPPSYLSPSSYLKDFYPCSSLIKSFQLHPFPNPSPMVILFQSQNLTLLGKKCARAALALSKENRKQKQELEQIYVLTFAKVAKVAKGPQRLPLT